MKKFVHFNAKTLDEAVTILERYQTKAKIIAGGTDLLGKMKDDILHIYPEALVNIKNVAGLNLIEEKEGDLEIGALTLLEDVAKNSTIKAKYAALSESARRTASPHLREMGTIGGNICQDIRCWYYRNPNNRFPCLRKGGGKCYALEGDKRYHSIFGGSVSKGCIAVHPSDTAPALTVLGACVLTTKRKIHIDDFFQVDVCKTTALENDEILTKIVIPKPKENSKSAFLKFAFRKSIDFPIVNCAISLSCVKGQIEDVKICLNSVFIKPYRALKAENYLLGKQASKLIAERAGILAVEDAEPLGDNDYMINVSRALVARAVLSCKD